MLRLSGGNGSVTVKDWFASSTKRVEQLQFADGTVWNEAAIRARVGQGGGQSGGQDSGHGNPGNNNDGGYGAGGDDRSGHSGGGNHGDPDADHGGGHHGRHDRDDDDRGNELRDAIGARLAKGAHYDFTALAAYLARENGGGYGAMTAQQIANRWLAVQNCVSNLAHADDDDGHGGHGGAHHGSFGGGDDRDRDGHGWGHGGSTGQSNGCGGMDTFGGLGEGFRRL